MDALDEKGVARIGTQQLLPTELPSSKQKQTALKLTLHL